MRRKENLKNKMTEMDIDDLMIEYPGVPYNAVLEAKKYVDAFIADVDSDIEVGDN